MTLRKALFVRASPDGPPGLLKADFRKQGLLTGLAASVYTLSFSGALRKPSCFSQRAEPSGFATGPRRCGFFHVICIRCAPRKFLPARAAYINPRAAFGDADLRQARTIPEGMIADSCAGPVDVDDAGRAHIAREPGGQAVDGVVDEILLRVGFRLVGHIMGAAPALGVGAAQAPADDMRATLEGVRERCIRACQADRSCRPSCLRRRGSACG